MKRFFLVVLILILILAGALAVGWMYLPRIGMSLLGKAIGGSVEVGKSEFSLSQGLFTIDLTDIKATGSVKGTIKRCRAQLRIGTRLYVNHLAISDFDVTVEKGKGEPPPFYPVPVELAQIERGTLVYEGRKFIIREIRVRHFNTGGPFEFSIDAGAEGLGDLKTKGEGLFRDKRSDIRGEYSIAGLEMGKILKGYKATLGSEGTFSYKKETLTVEGRVEGSPFWMLEDFQKKPITFEHKACRIRVVRAGDKIEIGLDKLEARGAPLSINISVEKGITNRIEVVSGFVDVPFIKEYIDAETLGERIPQIIEVVSDGEASIKRLAWDRRKPFSAEIDLRGVEAGYRDFDVDRIEGTLVFEGDKLLLSGMKGYWKESLLHDVNGVIPFSAQKDVRIKGNFSAAINDLMPFAELKGVAVQSGRTEGALEVIAGKEKEVSVVGKGSLRETQFTWKGVELKAWGDYTIRDREIDFNPFFVSNGSTDLMLKGKVGKDAFEANMRGLVDAGLVKSLTRFPHRLEGAVQIEGRVEKRGEEFLVRCTASMDNTSFDIPGFIKKARGFESRTDFDLSVRGKTVNIKKISYNLGAAVVSGSGKIGAGRGEDLHLVMTIPGLEKVQQFFFFDNTKAGGDINVDLFVHDLRLPLKRLPSINGFITVRNGAFAFPSLANPIKNVDMTCNFRGTTFNVDIVGLRSGMSRLRQGKLVVTDTLPLSFSLVLQLEQFNPTDFKSKAKKRFRIPVIPADNILADAEGALSVKIDKLRINEAEATDVGITGRLQQRRLEINEIKARAFGGSVNGQAMADLSGDVPVLQAAGRADAAEGEEFFKMFTTAKPVSGKGVLFGNVRASGHEGNGILRSMEGNISLYSRNGVIHRWTLLSRIFGLLNLYDLFRGKIDLAAQGLTYNRLGAEFEGKDGVFSTKDFIIDSASMLITGSGSIRPAERSMEGRVTVSPLVTLDKAINVIPVVRSLIKEEEKGFLFVVYDVKGPVGDPDVKVSYVATLGSRALDILRNILRFPTGVFER